MEDLSLFTNEERKDFDSEIKLIDEDLKSMFSDHELKRISELIKLGIDNGVYARSEHGINQLLKNIKTSSILIREVGLKRSSIVAVLLYPMCEREIISASDLAKEFGEDIEPIINGLLKVNSLYVKNEVIEIGRAHV